LGSQQLAALMHDTSQPQNGPRPLNWLAIAACLLAAEASAADELEHCRRLAAKYSAKCEVRLHDDTRVDLLSPTHAIEVDWAANWAESMGQSVHYGLMTGR